MEETRREGGEEKEQEGLAPSLGLWGRGACDEDGLQAKQRAVLDRTALGNKVLALFYFPT